MIKRETLIRPAVGHVKVGVIQGSLTVRIYTTNDDWSKWGYRDDQAFHYRTYSENRRTFLALTPLDIFPDIPRRQKKVMRVSWVEGKPRLNVSLGAKCPTRAKTCEWRFYSNGNLRIELPRYIGYDHLLHKDHPLHKERQKGKSRLIKRVTEYFED